MIIRSFRRAAAASVACALVFALAGIAEAASCESLAALAGSTITITGASVVPAGGFSPPASTPIRADFGRLRSFCRVTATLTPSADSDIHIEVWLPEAGWNGDFQAVGNESWAGLVSYSELAAAVAGGYAAASTDAGHAGNTAAFALDHPERIIDMGYRAVHEMTVQAKAIVEAFYGVPARRALWNGCSTGGRQGIAAAVRYPGDFDAVAAGAPAVNWLPIHAGRIAFNQTVNAAARPGVPPAKYQLVHRAALEACDSLDGVSDGVIENPLACRFDPQVLACPGSDTADCLTPPQVESARAFYRAVRGPEGLVMPGLVPGSEPGWGILGGEAPHVNAVEGMRFIVFKDPNWDWRTFDLGAAWPRLRAADPDDVLSASSTNLGPFFARGGKLLMYHGWSDGQVPPEVSINFFEQVAERVGRDAVGAALQLYMVPGMNHCGGGAGTDIFDRMGPLQEWIDTGRAPASLPAAHATGGVVDRRRPLCPYGQAAQWSGRGSTSDAANFSCVAVPPGPRATR